MLIEEMLEAFEKGTLGEGKDLEWLELHQWQIGNAMADLSLRHESWTDLDGVRMDLLIRVNEYFTKLINYWKYEPDSGKYSHQSSHRQPFGFSGFGAPTSIQYPEYGPSGYSGLD